MMLAPKRNRSQGVRVSPDAYLDTFLEPYQTIRYLLGLGPEGWRAGS